MLKQIIYTLLFLVAVTACKDDKIDDDVNRAKQEKFLQQTVSGVYDGDVALFIFDEANHQMAFTADRKMWRIQTDAQDKYVHCELAAAPAVQAENVVSVKVKGVDVSAGEMAALVLKMENNKCWLWGIETGIGFLMQADE